MQPQIREQDIFKYEVLEKDLVIREHQILRLDFLSMTLTIPVREALQLYLMLIKLKYFVDPKVLGQALML